MEQFKVNFEALRKAVRTDRWARGALLVAVAGNQGDGTSGLRADDGSFAARRQSIEAFADIVFSSTPQQVAFWSGEGADDRKRIEQLYGGLKPCLHGSDAHTLDRLGLPDQSRHTWVKGDPTFDTLKLACLAPLSRCHIGVEPPTAGYDHGRVTEVSVPDAGWFVNNSVPVNPGLVAIIGARGSGKTALADLIAAGAGSEEPFENDSSFVRRAGRLLDDATAAVEWSHGDITICDFATGYVDAGPLRPVRYLSQQFVERLCASDGVSDELLVEIERVVFEAWPVGQREGATSFRELLDLRLAAARSRQQTELDAVLDLSDRITEIRHQRRMAPRLEQQHTAQQRRVEALDRQIAALTQRADPVSAKRLEIVSALLQARQEELQRHGRTRTSLLSLRSQVAAARGTAFPAFVEKLRTGHVDAGLDDAAWAAFTLDFAGDVDALLDRRLEAVDEAIAVVGGNVEGPELAPINLDELSATDLADRTAADLGAETDRLRKLVGLDEGRAKQLKDLLGARGEAQTVLGKLTVAIQQAQTADSDDLVRRRLGHYRAYFDALLEEEQELRELYRPLDLLLSNFGASIAKLRFTVRRVVDVADWAGRGEDLLDLRREGRFRGTGELALVARGELAPSWELGDAEAATAAIDRFATDHSDDFRRQRKGPQEDDASPTWDQRVTRWMYGTDHITLRYSLDALAGSASMCRSWMS